MRAHMPPWLYIGCKTPRLCHQFRLLIELSGRGQLNGPKWVSSTTKYCALFKNLIIFCQGTFTAPDETAPPTPPNTTCLGFVFLQNLKGTALASNLDGSSKRVMQFTLDFDLGDSLSFNIIQQEFSVIEKWHEALLHTFQRSSLSETDPSFLSVPFNLHEIPCAQDKLDVSFAMLAPSMYTAPLNLLTVKRFIF